MNIDWINLLNNIGIFAVSSGFFIWLVKKIFEVFIDKDIEKYKDKLNQELQKFKNELKIVEIEKQVAYTRLHNDRAELIKQLYQKVAKLRINLSEFTRTLDNKLETREDDVEKNMNILFNEVDSLSLFYSENKIYFNEKIDVLMYSILLEYDFLISLKNIVFNPLKYEHKFNELYNNEKNIEQEVNKFKESLKESNGNEEKLLNELEIEFRKYLGVV